MLQTLSIVIPVYNEPSSLPLLLEKVGRAPLPGGISREIIVVDDGSDHHTAHAIETFVSANPQLALRHLRHASNRGKGAALHTAIAHATGEYLIVQDADLEYDPAEYGLMLRPVLDGFADVVYGSRFIGGKAHRVSFFWHSAGNRFITLLGNLFTNLQLTDMGTGFKLFPTESIRSISLVERRFGFDAEVTAKIARLPRIRIYEIGVSYHGRGYEDGKKARWKDGLRALYCTLKYGLFRG